MLPPDLTAPQVASRASFGEMPQRTIVCVSRRPFGLKFALTISLRPNEELLRLDHDISSHSQAKLNAIARQLNERPRKTLGYQTPAEMFNHTVASTG
jgi:hypothetical protein